MELSYDRERVRRYLRIAIIFSLIPDSDVENIITKRTMNFPKRYMSKRKSIEAFEKTLDLADERKRIIKKINFCKKVFKDQECLDELMNKYTSRLIEIEEYAFR